MLDPLGAVTKTRAGVQQEEEGIGEAPVTITDREQMFRPSTDDYFYHPDLGNVPEFDLPSYLPDLPGMQIGLQS